MKRLSWDPDYWYRTAISNLRIFLMVISSSGRWLSELPIFLALLLLFWRGGTANSGSIEYFSRLDGLSCFQSAAQTRCVHCGCCLQTPILLPSLVISTILHLTPRWNWPIWMASWLPLGMACLMESSLTLSSIGLWWFRTFLMALWCCLTVLFEGISLRFCCSTVFKCCVLAILVVFWWLLQQNQSQMVYWGQILRRWARWTSIVLARRMVS